jgi:4'-phosphopantetheinyl transferase
MRAMQMQRADQPLPPLDDADVHLWWAATAPGDDVPGRRRGRLDALLRAVLARYVDAPSETLRFGREPHGRPFLLGADMPDFNLSDTRGGSVIAVVRRGRIGVDLERLDRALPHRRLAQRYFAPAECEVLQAMDDDDARAAFLRLWTAKEASCKSTGTGIHGWLSQWQFDPIALAPQLRALPSDAGDAGRWHHLRVSPHPEYTAVLACEGYRPVLRGVLVDAAGTS